LAAAAAAVGVGEAEAAPALKFGHESAEHPLTLSPPINSMGRIATIRRRVGRRPPTAATAFGLRGR
jgi:hypothetical protein